MAYAGLVVPRAPDVVGGPVGRRSSRSCVRAARALLAAAAVALVLAVGAGSWLSANGSAPTPGRTGAAWSVPSSSGRLSLASSPLSVPSPSPSCETSQGLVPVPDSFPSGWSLPSWVSASDTPGCVLLDASSLREPSAPVTVTEAPSPSSAAEPSPSPQLSEISSKLDRTTQLLLYSGGLAIFLLGIVAFRSRR